MRPSRPNVHAWLVKSLRSLQRLNAAGPSFDLDQRLGAMNAAIATAQGDADLVEVGIYPYRHRLDDAVAYKS